MGARSHGGFSLLEAMIALSILAVGIIGMTAGQLAATRLSSHSQGKMLAMHLAEQQIEIFQVMPATAVIDLMTDGDYPNDPTNPIDPIPGDSEELTFDRRWIVEPDTPEAGVMRITVEVDWVDSRGATRTLRLQTLKAG